MLFNNHKEVYNEAIHNSGYKNKLKFIKIPRHNNNRDKHTEFIIQIYIAKIVKKKIKVENELVQPTFLKVLKYECNVIFLKL